MNPSQQVPLHWGCTVLPWASVALSPYSRTCGSSCGVKLAALHMTEF